MQDPPNPLVQVPQANNTVNAVLDSPLTSARKRLARVPGLVGTGTDYSVADNIPKKFADGWGSHIPLTFLTDKGCSAKTKSPLNLTKDFLTLDPDTGTIQTSLTSLVDDGELDLTFDKWHQAWRRLLDLIKTYLPQEYPLWEIHYSTILNKKIGQNYGPCTSLTTSRSVKSLLQPELTPHNS